MERIPSPEANPLSASQKIPAFCGREVSLPLSQAPATCPYPESDHFSPWLPIPLLEYHFNLFLPSAPRSSKWSIFLKSNLQIPL